MARDFSFATAEPSFPASPMERGVITSFAIIIIFTILYFVIVPRNEVNNSQLLPNNHKIHHTADNVTAVSIQSAQAETPEVAEISQLSLKSPI